MPQSIFANFGFYSFWQYLYSWFLYVNTCKIKRQTYCHRQQKAVSGWHCVKRHVFTRSVAVTVPFSPPMVIGFCWMVATMTSPSFGATSPTCPGSTPSWRRMPVPTRCPGWSPSLSGNWPRWRTMTRHTFAARPILATYSSIIRALGLATGMITNN